MRYLFTFLAIFFTTVAAAQNNKFDSVKIYSIPFYAETHNKIDIYTLLVSGDSIKIVNESVVIKLFNDLNNLLKEPSKKRLRKLRKNWFVSDVAPRTAFIFFSGNRETIIGVSAQNMMFLDNELFVGNNKKFEKIIRSISLELYKRLFVGQTLHYVNS